MRAVREALVLPFLFLTIALLGGTELGTRVVMRAPSLFALILATMMVAALVRGGALDPERLLHGSRPMLANANGAVVLVTLLAAASQVVSMLTPHGGLPLFFTDVLLFVLLVNTLVTQPERPRLLRSLAVTLGAALMLKFVVLASLSSPAASRTGRVLMALFDAATFGSLVQEPQSPVEGYVAFLTVVMFLIGVSTLPGRADVRARGTDLMRRT